MFKSLAFVRFRALILAASISGFGFASPGQAQEGGGSWADKSNENAQVLLEVFARFAPESAGQLGVEGLDEQIFGLEPGLTERVNEAVLQAVSILNQRLGEEENTFVRQDLEILIQAGEQSVESSRLNRKYNLPYFNLSQTIFQGIRSLLDDQIAADRRGAALVRLRKYAGLEEGYTPISELAMDRIRERLSDPSLQAPFNDRMEKDLQNAPAFKGGIAQLFDKYEITGYEEAYTRLSEQLDAYHEFIRAEVLPRAKTDFRLPAELYDFALQERGIDIPVPELTSRAQVAFKEIQNEMHAIAPLVAAERGYSVTDYRGVIRELKKEQLVGEEILVHYEKRIRELEELILAQKVVTLPERAMRVRIATEAEAAAIPAPNMRPPRLIGNTGEMGEFVLPLKIPGEEGEEVGFDDFTFAAASWTLTVHEGRPGHELQFAAIIEHGVSVARTVFAFNSVNVEGWALYAEAEMKPYMPLDGQLIGLQHRLLRAARAYLDPGLQKGTITRDEAFRILEEEVVLSHAMALQEVERYTFRSPGQAPSYFYGYTRLMELRTEVERTLGHKFDLQRFHDFILSQGLLPPALLREAVMEQFVVEERRQA